MNQNFVRKQKHLLSQISRHFFKQKSYLSILQFWFFLYETAVTN